MKGVLKSDDCVKKTELRKPVIILLVLLVLPNCTLGNLNLNAHIRNQSLDGRLIQLNGAIGCETGTFIGWWYEWGDGTITSSYFPTYHRYESPGLYEILVKGYDDQGNSKTVSVKHEVFALPVTDVNEVHLSEYFVGLSDSDDIGYVEIIAKNASGETVPLSEHNVSLYDPMYSEVTPAFKNHLSGSNLITHILFSLPWLHTKEKNCSAVKQLALVLGN